MRGSDLTISHQRAPEAIRCIEWFGHTKGQQNMLMTKEHYTLLEMFEREHKHYRLSREKNKELWKRGHIYEDGHVNDLFLAYRKGYALGTVSGEAAEKLAAAPVAIMDPRDDALGLCAPTEEDFPALYALQGRRVALVDLGPNVRAKGLARQGQSRLSE